MIGRACVVLAAGWLLAGQAAAATHTIVIEQMRFTPAALTIQRGDTVLWVNRDLMPHTASAAGRFDSGKIEAGRSWRLRVSQPGLIAYVCNYHPGMQAFLKVK